MNNSNALLPPINAAVKYPGFKFNQYTGTLKGHYKKQKITVPPQTLYSNWLQNTSAPQTGLNSIGHLTLFPKWAVATVNNQNKTKITSLNDQILNNLNNPDFALLRRLAQQKINGVQWNNATGRWQGSFIDSIKKGFVSKLKNYKQGRIRSNTLINNKLTPQQTYAVLPPVLNQIYQINRQLKLNGVGPKATGKYSLPFYVGRFKNSKTGRVDLLPQAKQKYLNPFSYAQKRAYLQARVINHWNQFLEASQKYMKIKDIDPDQYVQNIKQKMIKRISNLGSRQHFIRKIANLMVKYMLNQYTTKQRYSIPFLLTQKIYQRAMRAGEAGAQFINISLDIKMLGKQTSRYQKVSQGYINGFQTLLNAAQNQLLRQVQDSDGISNQQKTKIYTRIKSFVASYTFNSLKQYAPLLKNIAKGQTLTTNNVKSPAQMTQIKNTIDKQLKRINGYTRVANQRYTNTGALKRAINNIQRTEKLHKQKIDYNQPQRIKNIPLQALRRGAYNANVYKPFGAINNLIYQKPSLPQLSDYQFQRLYSTQPQGQIQPQSSMSQQLDLSNHSRSRRLAQQIQREQQGLPIPSNFPQIPPIVSNANNTINQLDQSRLNQILGASGYKSEVNQEVQRQEYDEDEAQRRRQSFLSQASRLQRQQQKKANQQGVQQATAYYLNQGLEQQGAKTRDTIGYPNVKILENPITNPYLLDYKALNKFKLLLGKSLYKDITEAQAYLRLQKQTVINLGKILAPLFIYNKSLYPNYVSLKIALQRLLPTIQQYIQPDLADYYKKIIESLSNVIISTAPNSLKQRQNSLNRQRNRSRQRSRQKSIQSRRGRAGSPMPKILSGLGN